MSTETEVERALRGADAELERWNAYLQTQLQTQPQNKLPKRAPLAEELLQATKRLERDLEAVSSANATSAPKQAPRELALWMRLQREQTKRRDAETRATSLAAELAQAQRQTTYWRERHQDCARRLARRERESAAALPRPSEQTQAHAAKLTRAIQTQARSTAGENAKLSGALESQKRVVARQQRALERLAARCAQLTELRDDLVESNRPASAANRGGRARDESLATLEQYLAQAADETDVDALAHLSPANRRRAVEQRLRRLELGAFVDASDWEPIAVSRR